MEILHLTDKMSNITDEEKNDHIFYDSKLRLLTRINEYANSEWRSGFITGFLVGVLATSSIILISAKRVLVY